jgi:hypothetical protein
MASRTETRRRCCVARTLLAGPIGRSLEFRLQAGTRAHTDRADAELQTIRFAVDC